MVRAWWRRVPVCARGKGDTVLTDIDIDIDIEKLRTNLQKPTRDIGQLLGSTEEQAGFRLKQIEVAVEICAEGGVTLIATLTVTGKAALTLTFERP